MRLSTTCVAAITTALAWPGLYANAAGKVDVSYIKAEQFSDAGRGTVDRERTESALTAYLQSLGRELGDGQTLKIEVLDVDLAGELRPLRSTEIRVLSGRADWPRIELRYTLAGPQGTIKTGDARLADMNYLFGTIDAGLRQEDLPYEKRMLRKWFEATFVAH